MGTTAPTSKVWLRMVLGYAAVEMVGCGDNGTEGDDNVASRTAAIVVALNACPKTTPPTDIFVKKIGVLISGGNMNTATPGIFGSSSNSDREFIGDGRPICFRGIPFPLELPPILVRFAPTNVYVSMEGSIGQCGLSPDEPVPLLSPHRAMGPLLTVPCRPNNSQSGPATCVLPRLTAEDFNHCLR